MNFGKIILALSFLNFIRRSVSQGFAGNAPIDMKSAVYDVLDYFRQDDPRGIPVLNIPEPLSLNREVKLSQISLSNPVITGHSRLKLDALRVNLGDLEAELQVSLPYLEITAPYIWGEGWVSSEGEANLTCTNLQVRVTIQLEVSEEGLLAVQGIKTAIDKDEFSPAFTGLSALHGAAVALADTFFDSVILPLAQQRISEVGRKALMERFQKIFAEEKFPVDVAFFDFFALKKLNEIQMDRKVDPLYIEEKVIDLHKYLTLKVEETYLYGLSTLHRTQDISVEYIDNIIFVLVQMGAKDLVLDSTWSAYNSLLSLGSGTIKLTISRIDISVELVQDADVAQAPVISAIDIQLGDVAFISSGDRMLDFALESVANTLPNILKDILDKRIETILKQRIQQRLDTVSLRRIILDRLDRANKSKVTE